MINSVPVSHLVDFHRQESNKIYLQAFIAFEVIVASVAAIIFYQHLFLAMSLGLIIVAGAVLYQCALQTQEIQKMVKNAHLYLSSVGGSYL